MLLSLALSLACFLSGAAGLIFQLVWFYQGGLVFGSSVASATVVLSGFMAGLACGNALAGSMSSRFSRQIRTYAVLEAVVAVAGLIVTYVLPEVSVLLVPLARLAGDTGALVNAFRFALAFSLLAVPATAMGATLPLLVSAMCRNGGRFGPTLGALYGWNTIGAVAGVVISETLLIGACGVTGTAWAAALLNAGAASLALTARTGEFTDSNGGVQDTSSTRSDGRGSIVARGAQTATLRCRPVPLYAATALAGAVLLALEVLWFRLLSMYVLVTTLAMSLMLAVVLVSIGIGGLVASAWLRRRPDARRALPALASASGLLTLGSCVAFQTLTTGTQVGQWWIVLWFAAVLTLPTACLSGVLFTVIGDCLHEPLRTAASSAGRLTLANTLGAALGAPLATYVLLPVLGLERGLVMLGASYGAVALLAGLSLHNPAIVASSWRSRLWSAASAGALLVALAAYPLGAGSDRYYARAAAAYADDGSTMVASKEGVSETLFVMQQRWLGAPVYSRLVTNGFSMSGTALLGQRYMRAFAYYPMLLHDGPLKRALVVCYGVGVTVGAVTHIPSIEAIDVAEISRDVVGMSDVIYPANERPLDDPRVRLHIEDGRFFLQTTRERFDLITGEPPPPRTPGTVNIYTREYFRLVHDRLAEGGLATYWVPVARPDPGTDVNTVIKAFCDVFADCSLWNATPFDLMLVGTRGLRGPRSVEEFTAPWQTPGLEARLREVGFERAEQIGATFIGDASYLKALTRQTPALTDDFPQRLRPVAGRPSLSDPGYGSDQAVTRMFQDTLDVERARSAFLSSPFVRALWPPDLVERTLPYFDHQAAINRVYWEGGRPLRQIELLDALLTSTTLRTLPLWVLGSDEVKQRIGESGAGTQGETEYARGLRALSGRDFGGAITWLNAASSRGVSAATVRPLLAYALFKSGQGAQARALIPAVTAQEDDEAHFWKWLAARVAAAS